MEIVVGPARRPTDRRTPERAAEHAADDGTGDRAGRPGDYQTSTCAGRSADMSARAVKGAAATAAKIVVASKSFRIASSSADRDTWMLFQRGDKLLLVGCCRREPPRTTREAGFGCGGGPVYLLSGLVRLASNKFAISGNGAA
jgi:hypothetical protein